MILAMILAAALLGCSKNEKSADSQHTAQAATGLILTAEQSRTAGIRVAEVSWKTLEQTITLRGELELPPQNIVTVSVPINARVRSIAVLPGTDVHHGQILVELESVELIQLQEQYLTTELQHARVESEYRRQQTLFASQATSERALLEARTEWQRLRIMRAALSERLRMLGIDPAALTDSSLVRTLTVRAPCNCTVYDVPIRTGQIVSAQQPLLQLVRLDDLHLVLRAIEQNVPSLQRGQRLEAWLPNNPNVRYSARIISITPMLDSTRTLAIHCHFETIPRALRPGMTMTATLAVQSISGYAVPGRAIVRRSDGEYVFIPSGQGYQPAPVRVLLRQSDSALVESTSGIPLSRVVSEGAHWLLMMLDNTEQE